MLAFSAHTLPSRISTVKNKNKPKNSSFHVDSLKPSIPAHLLQTEYLVQFVRDLVVAKEGVTFVLLPSCPRGREGPAGSVFMCLSVSKPITPEMRREQRGCDLAWVQLLRNSRCTFQFNMALPRSPHACLRACQALLETRCYWTKAAAPLRHTQQLFSGATYHLMTLMEGKSYIWL